MVRGSPSIWSASRGEGAATRVISSTAFTIEPANSTWRKNESRQREHVTCTTSLFWWLPTLRSWNPLWFWPQTRHLQFLTWDRRNSRIGSSIETS